MTLPDPTAALIGAHLRENAGRYLPGERGSEVRVTLLRVDRRSVSRLYRFDVRVGDRREEMLVKVPVADAEVRRGPQAPAGKDRPRRAITPDPATKAELEHATLRAIHEHFAGLEDPRLGAVRVYDYLPQERAVVMQCVSGESLRGMVMRAWRAQHGDALVRLCLVFGHVGSWLREFHALPAPLHVRQRHATRAEFIAYVGEVADFLGVALDDRAYFAGLAARAGEAAHEVLPAVLPLGRAHGDLAMRNVLVSPGGRVTVLDTLGRFTTPVYEDVGYFLGDLKCNPVHGLGWLSRLGRERVTSFASAFLAGYFGSDASPARAVALYEAQAMLDRWASYALRRERASSARTRLARRTQAAMMAPLFRSLLHDRLRAAMDDGGRPMPVVRHA